jgi:glycerol-3-phosphate cytidylyltransferase-like family protein
MRSIRWADEVVEESTYFPTVDTLDEHNCAFHVHGGKSQNFILTFHIFSLTDDISLSADGTDVLDHLKAANRYREIPRTEGISTTALVSRILARINGVNCQVGFTS